MNAQNTVAQNPINSLVKDFLKERSGAEHVKTLNDLLVEFFFSMDKHSKGNTRETVYFTTEIINFILKLDELSRAKGGDNE